MEDRQIEGLAVAEPDYVARVICKIIAGIRVSKDRELVTVQYQPLRELAELCGRYSQLAASARVRSDRTEMIVPLGNTEPFMGPVAKHLGLLDFLRIEIDVRVEVPDHRNFAALIVELVQKRVDGCNGFGFAKLGGMPDIGHDSEFHVGCSSLHLCYRIGCQ